MSKNVVNFESPTLGQVEIKRLGSSAGDAEAYAKPFQEILSDSWTKRFTEEVFPPMTTPSQLKQRFNPNSISRVLDQKTKIQLAGRESATYYAAQLQAESGLTAVIGLGKVISYKPESKLKAVAGFKRYPYPYFHDVDVRPDYQGQGVGSALMLTMLKEFKGDKPASLYAYEGNEPSITWFEELGFAAKGVQQKKDLLGEGTVVNEIHFEAPAVSGVRSAILANRPHLEEIA